jgi:hypothetical protein
LQITNAISLVAASKMAGDDMRQAVVTRMLVILSGWTIRFSLPDAIRKQPFLTLRLNP